MILSVILDFLPSVHGKETSQTERLAADLLLDTLTVTFGVPEIWRYDGTALHVAQLQPEGGYALQKQSPSFPFLRLADIPRFLNQRNATDETSWIRSFREWVRGLRECREG